MIRSAENAAITPGGFVDDGRTVIWLEGNGEPGPMAATLSVSGALVGTPWQPLGADAMVGGTGIMPVAGGTGVAMHLLPDSSHPAERLVRLGAGAKTVSTADLPGTSWLLAASDSGAVLGFLGSDGGFTIRTVGWDGSLHPVLGTIPAVCAGDRTGGGLLNGPLRPGPVTGSDPGRFLAVAVPTCSSNSTVAWAGATIRVFPLDGAPNLTLPTASSGGVDSLWWNAAEGLSWHAAGNGKTYTWPRNNGMTFVVDPNLQGVVDQQYSVLEANVVLSVRAVGSGGYEGTLSSPGQQPRVIGRGDRAAFAVG